MRSSVQVWKGKRSEEVGSSLNRLLKNAHLRRSPLPSSLQRTFEYASLLRMSGALHLGVFDQPEKYDFFKRLFRQSRIKLG